AGDFTQIAWLEKALAFNVSGHVLHSLFWRNLSPRGGGKPDRDLATAIQRDFGSFERFRDQLTAAASTIMGSGWGALVFDPLTGRLLTCQIYDHESNLSQTSIPLMVLDAWEHAYYPQYQSRRSEFFEALWQLWNWKDVASRFDQARRADLQLP